MAEAVGLSDTEVKKRWRSLRDAFIKHVKHNPDEMTRGQMLHYDLMKFLTPYVTGENARTRAPRPKKYKLDSDDVTNVIYIQNEDMSGNTEYIRAVKMPRSHSTDEVNMVEEHISVELADQSELEEVPEHKIFIPTSKRQRLEESVEVEEHVLPESYTIEEKEEGVHYSRSYEPSESVVTQSELDSDEKFLLSLGPAMKRLNTKKNFLARIKIQQLLFEMEFDEKYD